MLARSAPTTAPGSGRVLCFACLLLPMWLRLPLQESLEALHQRAFAAAEATAFVVGNRVKKPWCGRTVSWCRRQLSVTAWTSASAWKSSPSSGSSS
jgi:hypothetical protein